MRGDDETTTTVETTTPEELTEDPTEDETDDPSEEPGDPGEQTAVREALEDGGVMAQGEGPAIVTWTVPGETLHIYVRGSSTPGCYLTPTEAWTDGESFEITFSPPSSGQVCTQDLVSHGWEVTWEAPFDVTEPMPMVLTDIPQLGQTYEGELPVEQTAGTATQ